MYKWLVNFLFKICKEPTYGPSKFLKIFLFYTPYYQKNLILRINPISYSFGKTFKRKYANTAKLYFRLQISNWLIHYNMLITITNQIKNLLRKLNAVFFLRIFWSSLFNSVFGIFFFNIGKGKMVLTKGLIT